MIDSHHRWWSSSMIRLNFKFKVIIKLHVLWPLFFGTPPKTPPPKFPPPVCKIWRFLGPPPDPPFFEVLTPDPLIQDPCPQPWCSLIVWFDLMLWWSSIIIIIVNDVMFINFIYKHNQSLLMHQGDPSCMRTHDSSSRVLLQKNTSPLPITMAKPAFFTPPTV